MTRLPPRLLFLIAIAPMIGSCTQQASTIQPSATERSADDYTIRPYGIEAKPGQYTGYLDWNAKQVFHGKGLTPEEATGVASCTNSTLYQHLTKAEQATLDAAARTNGMSEDDTQAFWQAVEDRMGEDEVRRISVAGCREQYRPLSKLFDGS